MKWTKKKIESKQLLTAVFAAADGINVWVAAMTDEPTRLIGQVYQSSDAGEHWFAVPGMSVPVDYLTGTADGKHLWAMGHYIRKGYHKVLDRYGQRLYHLVEGTPSVTESPVEFDRFRHGLASSDDGAFLSGLGHERGRGGMSVLCSANGGQTWKA